MKELIYSKEDLDLMCTLELEEERKEIERLHSIIKEAREYIQDRYDGEVLTHTFDKDNVKELLEILDKVEENEENNGNNDNNSNTNNNWNTIADNDR